MDTIDIGLWVTGGLLVMVLLGMRVAFAAGLAGLVGLEGFLEQVSLVAEIDLYDEDEGAVTLMTLHSAKGLEFPHVFLAGMEEELLPHRTSIEEGSIEEERRLAYVGMTRAKERLYLTACQRRRRGGFYQDQRESRFLDEIPEKLLEVEVPERCQWLRVASRNG